MYITMHVHHTIKMTNDSRGKIKEDYDTFKSMYPQKMPCTPKIQPLGVHVPSIKFVSGHAAYTEAAFIIVENLSQSEAYDQEERFSQLASPSSLATCRNHKEDEAETWYTCLEHYPL